MPICSAVMADPPATGDWQLVWSDEFNSSSAPIAPDSSNWGYENGYVRNKEWQYYTNNIQNAYCQNGYLHIEAHQHPPGTYPTGSEPGQDGSISSASIRSMNKVYYKYGYFEIRARIDTQLGSWPAFWSLGVSGAWPDCGECDIMEYYQNKLLFNVAWWKTGDPQWTARWDSVTCNLSSLPPSWPDEFHVWAMEWDASSVKLYMDGVLYNTWDSSQDDNGGGDTSIEGFQQAHYMLINQAIGGTAGGDASGVVYPTNYEVDWVRIWQENSSAYCGDGTCSGYEDSCNCSDDCGLPPATEGICDDGLDDDCDGLTDSDDPDCYDFNPPTPDPATFAVLPEPAGGGSITMTSTTATDDMSSVEYYFKNITIPGHDSGWQTSLTYTDTGLTTGRVYGYTARYRDFASNKTEFSEAEFAVSAASEVVFSDDFETGSFGSNWTSTGSWTVVTARKYDGSYSAEIDGGVTDSALVSKDVDVSDSTTATVDFAWYIEGGLDSGEYLAFEVSSDGGGWTEIARLDGNVDPENTWIPETSHIDVSGTSTLNIRFLGTMSSSNEDAYVDAVQVTVAVSGGSVTVPDITGYDQTAAEKIITAAGLTVGTVDSDYSDSFAIGTVGYQTPAGGTSTTSGDPVDFTVSLGLLADLDDDDRVELSDIIILANDWLDSSDMTDFAQVSSHWLDSVVSPVAYWPFDGDAADESVNGWHGSLFGNASFTTDVQRDDVLTLDGDGDYVNIDEYEGVTGTGPRTVVAWIKTDSGDTIISWGQDAASQKWTFRVRPDGELRVAVNGGGVIGATQVNDGTWHHVAAVWDPGFGSDVTDVKLYVDGELETTSGSAYPINTASNVDVAIGVSLSSDKYFNGRIDDVRIYSRALSETEIEALAESL
jgi:beta-glucanase (GH16 family)